MVLNRPEGTFEEHAAALSQRLEFYRSVLR